MTTKIIVTVLFLIASMSLAYAERPSFTSLQQQINELQAQINQVDSKVDNLPIGRVHIYDADNTFLGISVAHPNMIMDGLVGAIYHPAVRSFVSLQFWHTANGVVVDMVYPRMLDIRYESFDCTGQAYVASPMSLYEGTGDVVFGNGIHGTGGFRYFKMIGRDAVEDRVHSYHSVLDSGTGECSSNASGDDEQARVVSPVAEITNPFPYSFPIKLPLRFVYVGQ